MANVRLNINCGCGYKTHDIEAASRHSDQTGHKVDIFGMITSEAKITESVTASKTTKTSKTKEIPVLDKDDMARIAMLRKKLNGG